MTNVISLDDRRLENSPHASGPAVCMGCGHEWQAVIPIPIPAVLECPSCGLEKGTPAGLCEPKGGMVLACGECDNQRFLVTPNGPFCEMCGHVVDMEDLDE